MKKVIILACILASTINYLYAQGANKAIIAIKEFSESEIKRVQPSVPKDGWYMLQTTSQSYLLNASNKDYLLSMSLTCKNASDNPSFLIEYSDKYRDGTFGGADFASSGNNSFSRIIFKIDGRDCGNPFDAAAPLTFEDFVKYLSKGKRLIISFFNTELNPETGEDDQKLNRNIDFKLSNGSLLMLPIDCE